MRAIPVYHQAKVLTTEGWVVASDLRERQQILVVDDYGIVREKEAVKVDDPEMASMRTMVRYKSMFRDVIEDERGAPVQNIGETPSPRNVRLAATLDESFGVKQPEYLIQLAIWVLSKAVIKTNEEGTVDHLLFSRMRSILRRRLKGVVSSAPGLSWSESGDTLRVTGPNLAIYLEAITGIEFYTDGARWFRLPEWLEELPASQGMLVAKELSYCSRRTFALRTSYYDGWKQRVGDKLQEFLFMRGIPSKMVYIGADQYTLVFNETGDLEFGRGTKHSVSEVACQTTLIKTEGSLIVRSNGTIAIVGVR